MFDIRGCRFIKNTRSFHQNLILIIKIKHYLGAINYITMWYNNFHTVTVGKYSLRYCWW